MLNETVIPATGLLVIVLGLVLVVIELFTPTLGILAVIGVLAFLSGGSMLYYSDPALLRTILPALIFVVVVLAILGTIIVRRVRAAYAHKAAAGQSESIVGQHGRVLEAIAPNQPGKVKVFGEVWDATSAQLLHEEARIRVVAMDTVARSLTVVSLNDAHAKK